MIAGTEANSSGLYGAMTFHHARLETLGRHVLSALHVEGRAAAQTSFSTFKRELDAHLEAEETWMLSSFALANPRSCDAVRAEHAKIRAAVELAGTALDTETIDEKPLCALLELLAAHCRTEEAELYRWSESFCDEDASRAVLKKIEAAELARK